MCQTSNEVRADLAQIQSSPNTERSLPALMQETIDRVGKPGQKIQAVIFDIFGTSLRNPISVIGMPRSGLRLGSAEATSGTWRWLRLPSAAFLAIDLQPQVANEDSPHAGIAYSAGFADSGPAET